MFEVVGLNYTYSSGRAGLDNVSLQAGPGERVVIMGPNGSGKSTLLRLVSTELPAPRGTLRLFESGWDSTSRRLASRRLRGRLGVVQDQAVHFDELTGMENGLFFAELYGVGEPEAEPRLAALFSNFGLEAVRDVEVGEYSYGMRKKLLLAEALVHDPELLILAWMAVLGLFYAPPGVPMARAGVEGANVVAGEVSIEQVGMVTTITASDGSIFEADRLNVLSDETLQFLQPNELARVLARVMGVDPTTIDGNLLANGVVYIVNPSGVFFGGSALVDVGRLVAGAGEISDADFRAGIDRFTGLEGRVENAGTIHAGAVTLLGRSVANHVIISRAKVPVII